MLVSIILGTAILAWLGHRVITRIIVPAEQRREQFRDDIAHGDWPALPVEMRGNHMEHSRGNTR